MKAEVKKIKRPERLTLAQTRDMMYEKFRTNVRMLRASTGESGIYASEKIGLKNGKRLLDLEYGRGNPTMNEAMLISKYFNVPLSNLLEKKANIIFD